MKAGNDTAEDVDRDSQPWPAYGAALDRINQDHVDTCVIDLNHIERMVGDRRLAADRLRAGIGFPGPRNGLLVDPAQSAPNGAFSRSRDARLPAPGANGPDDL